MDANGHELRPRQKARTADERRFTQIKWASLLFEPIYPLSASICGSGFQGFIRVNSCPFAVQLVWPSPLDEPGATLAILCLRCSFARNGSL
jgi:hypothetical protein